MPFPELDLSPADAPAGRAPPVSDRPRSASGVWTGMAGVVAALLALVLLRDWLQPMPLKTLAVLGISGAAMLAIDMLVYRVHLNASTGLAAQPLRGLEPMRVMQKLVGFWLTIGVVAGLYWLIPQYAGSYYEPFRAAALFALPGLVLLSPFYIAFVDRRQRQPVDAYAQIAMLLGGQRPQDWSALRTHALGWAVKAFFLPIMFVYVNNGLAGLWEMQALPALADFEHIFSRLIDLFYLIDVLIAAIAYALTLRVLDSQIRSVEPTLGGWAICLICYPPFWAGVGAGIFSYDRDGLFWGKLLAPYPVLYVAWGTAILALVCIYALSTVMFGLRFSNLTNRGIITSGPYRWVKHPAYLSKNISWWLISVPFVAGLDWAVAVQSSLLLAGVNGIYFLRAKTEERHLRADPAYRDYEAFIAQRGLGAVIGRLWRRRAG